MLFTRRRSAPGRRRWWPLGLMLAAGLAAVVAGLVWGGESPRSQGPAPERTSQTSQSAGSMALPGGPTSPPVRVCGNAAILGGAPSSPPKGAVVIPAGDDSDTVLAHDWTVKPNTTYWFAPGTHTLGTGQFSQIIPANGDTFIGAPGAIIDGQRSNLYAFTQTARNVSIRY